MRENLFTGRVVVVVDGLSIPKRLSSNKKYKRIQQQEFVANKGNSISGGSLQWGRTYKMFIC